MTGDYRWVETFDDLIRAIDCTFAATGRPVEVACRVDAGGDDRGRGSRGTGGNTGGAAIGFTMAAGAADCLALPGDPADALPEPVLAGLRHLLTSPRIRLRGANFKADMGWLAARLGIECGNFAFDPLLAGALLDENRANSLAAYARLYAEVEGESNEGESNDGEEEPAPREKLLRRLGRAVDAAFQSAAAIRRELLASPALAHFYVRLLHPASLAFGRLERRGVVASRERFEALRVELEGEDGRGGALADLDRQVLALLPGRLRMKYADNLSVRPALLRDFFFGTAGLHLKPRLVTPRHGEPSTAKAHLAMFHDVPEAAAMVALLDARSSAAKMLSAYVKGFLKHLHPDGRFHPAYRLFAGRSDDGDESGGGTVTGRTSARDPAIQTVPKRGTWAKKLRRCFVAPPGMAIWSADAAQGELKIAACLADEANMLAAYRAGLDLHAVTGASMMDLPTDAFMALAADVQDREKMERFELGRFKAKACIAEGSMVLTNHGLKRIENISLDDKVWDGIEWVEHGGVVCQGEREVVEYAGLVATPDHDVWLVDGRKVAFEEAIKEGATLAVGERAGQAIRVVAGRGNRGSADREENVQSALPVYQTRAVLWPRSLGEHGQPPVGQEYGAARLAVSEAWRRREDGCTRRGSEGVGRTIRRHLSAPLQSIVRVVPPIWWTRHRVAVLLQDGFHRLLSSSISRRGFSAVADRPEGQRRALRTEQYPARQSDDESAQQATEREGPLQGAGGERLRPVASAEDRLSRNDIGTASSTEAGLTWPVSGGNSKESRKTTCRVYDIVDAGPRHRFTVSGVVVSNCNFGLLYGMQAKGFVRYAWQTFKMVLTEAQAQGMIDRFFATYPGLLDWHEAARRRARRDGAVANPFGRVRHLPWIRSQDRQVASRAERQAINAPVQSTLSDLTCWALAEIDRQIPEAQPCAMIHDAIVGYCPEDRADEIGRRIVEVAGTLPIESMCGWRPQLRFTFDHEYGPDMGSMVKMKG